MTEITEGGLDDEALDHLCWKVVMDRNAEWPPDERAEECIEAVEDGELDPYDGYEHYEYGYHVGLYEAADDLVVFLEASNISVEERAQRYVEESDLDLTVPQTADELYGGDDGE